MYKFFSMILTSFDRSPFPVLFTSSLFWMFPVDLFFLTILPLIYSKTQKQWLTNRVGSWACELCGPIGPYAEEHPTFGFMICYGFLEILNNILTRGCAFLFCTETPRSCSPSGFQRQWILVGQFHTSFLPKTLCFLYPVPSQP